MHYEGKHVGIPGLIEDEKAIADPEVVAAFTDTHIAQMLGYLNITQLDRSSSELQGLQADLEARRERK